MSETERWIFGILILALFGLVGLVFRIVWNKIAALDTGALAQFIAKDTEREKSWWEWRKAENEEKGRSRSEVKERLDAHADAIKGHDKRITMIERNGH
jgi:hypothetical protein